MPVGYNLGAVPNRGDGEVVGLGSWTHLSHYPESFTLEGIYLIPGYFFQQLEGQVLLTVNLIFKVGYPAGKIVEIPHVCLVLGEMPGMVINAAVDSFKHALYVPDLALEEPGEII